MKNFPDVYKRKADYVEWKEWWILDHGTIWRGVNWCSVLGGLWYFFPAKVTLCSSKMVKMLGDSSCLDCRDMAAWWQEGANLSTPSEHEAWSVAPAFSFSVNSLFCIIFRIQNIQKHAQAIAFSGQHCICLKISASLSDGLGRHIQIARMFVLRKGIKQRGIIQANAQIN